MKKNIAIVAGGDSGEYEISIKSAAVVAQNIDREKYNVYKIELTKHKWVYRSDDGAESPVDRNDFSIIHDSTKIKFDCVFNIIHGTPGEDGKLQGYFDLIGLPYTSCGQLTSAITFNKAWCKEVVKPAGTLVSNSLMLRKDEAVSPLEILKQLSLPVFVKPNNGGSSVGMSKVKTTEELPAALEKAFAEDDEIIVEEFIKGTEVTNGIGKFNGEFLVFPLTEIVSKNDFFDYQAKYTTGLAEEITPARVSDEIREKCQQTSRTLYNLLGCKGVVRFDYIITEKGPYFLEVNTIPGLSENSIIPQQSRSIGIPVKELFTKIIEEALR